MCGGMRFMELLLKQTGGPQLAGVARLNGNVAKAKE